MKMTIITNNPRVNEHYSDKFNLEFFPDDTQAEILKRARNKIHLGAKLLIHPMPGRIKPHETPYKSVLLEEGASETNFYSVVIIEDSIKMTEKYLNNTVYTKYYDELTQDLQYIDKLLLDSGIEEIRGSRS